MQGAADFGVLLDERHHKNEQLRYPGQALLQREGLTFYDSAGFEDDDWESLVHIYESRKTDVPSKTGKFGMGSRSNFHVSPVMQIVSGTRHFGIEPWRIAGIDWRTDFVSEGLLAVYPDTCSPFVLPMFDGCSMSAPLKLRHIDSPWQCALE